MRRSSSTSRKPSVVTKGGAGALAFQYGVGGDRGGVQHLHHRARGNPFAGEDLAAAVDHAARIVVRRRGHLGGRQRAVGAEQGDVGEGAANIDGDAVGGHLSVDTGHSAYFRTLSSSTSMPRPGASSGSSAPSVKPNRPGHDIVLEIVAADLAGDGFRPAPRSGSPRVSRSPATTAPRRGWRRCRWRIRSSH